MSGRWRGPAIGLWFTVTLILGALYLTVPVSPDQALFDYIAWSHVQGDAYYADIAEQNWPGEMLFHELGVRLFGVHFWTFRLTDFLLLQAITIAGALLLRFSGARIAPWIFVALYPPLYVTSGYWMAGQRDIVAAGLLVAAAAAVLSEWRRAAEPIPAGRRSVVDRRLVAGALVGLAVLMRPTFVSFLFGLVLLEWVRFPNERGLSLRRLRGSANLFLGFAIPVVAALLAGAWTGSLDDFYEQAILFNLQAYPVQADRLRLLGPLSEVLFGSWHWITVLAALGLIVWIRTAGLVRAQFLIAGVIATGLASFLAQNKGFHYHLGALLPPFCLLVAHLVDQLVTARSAAATGFGRRASGIFLISVLALILLGTGKKLSHFRPHSAALAEGRFQPIRDQTGDPTWTEIQQIVTTINTQTQPGEHVLQWGRLFEVPYLAQRRSPIRFVSTPALNLLSDEFAGTDDWLAETQRDLKVNRPAFVLVEKRELSGRTATAAEAMLFQLLRSYEPVYETRSVVLLRSK